MSKDDDMEPDERAESTLQEALETLDGLDDAQNPLQAGKIEDEALDILCTGVGQAYVDGLNKPAGWFAGVMAEETNHLTKTDIKQRIAERKEELAAEQSDKTQLDSFIRDELESVTVAQSTDHKQGANYTWDFGNFKVETQSGKDGRGHYNWPNFRDLIHEAGGPNLADPVEDRRGGAEWRDFMSGLIDRRGETRRITGKRTKAVEQLRTKINQRVGYGAPESALEYSGIWVLTDATEVPDWWAAFGESASDERELQDSHVRELRVYDDLVDNVTEDVGVTRTAFWVELDARALTLPGASGVSMETSVNGTPENFWRLRPDIAVPRVYVPDPHAEHAGEATVLWGQQEDDDSPEEAPEPDENTNGFDGVGEIA